MQNQDITVKDNTVLADGVVIGTFDSESRAWAYQSILTEKRSDPRSEYWNDVRDMAESISSEIDGQVKDGVTGESLREWLLEHIHESIDGCQRIIYTRQAQECLIYSDNDGAYIENFGTDGVVSDGCINWSALAFSAFEQDVIEQLDANGVDVNNPGPDCEDCDDKAECQHDGVWLCESCKDTRIKDAEESDNDSDKAEGETL